MNTVRSFDETAYDRGLSCAEDRQNQLVALAVVRRVLVRMLDEATAEREMAEEVALDAADALAHAQARASALGELLVRNLTETETLDPLAVARAIVASFDPKKAAQAVASFAAQEAGL